MKKETYKIKGMHCASCVATIERVLAKTAGVHSASVNFASESALIEFDENVISESGLVKVVESVGYHLLSKNAEIAPSEKNKATEMPGMDMNAPEHNHMEMIRQDQMKEMKLKLVIGSVLSLLVFLGSFPEWFSFVPKIFK